MTSIPLSRPPVDDEIKQAVLAAIDSRWYILGPQCRDFEAELARYVGVRHCVLSNSATAGLWLNIIFVILIPIFVFALAGRLFGT